MKLAQALIEKNKIIKRIGTLEQRISSNNSIMEGNERAYDPNELLTELSTEMDNLVAIKKSISLANAPIQENIFRMAELKSHIKFLRGISTAEGKVKERYSNELPLSYDAAINEVAKDNLIAAAEKTIESLQQEVDTFNHSTDI